MRVRTRRLAGAALDYAVAVAEGGTGFRYDTVATYWITLNGRDRALSKGWAQSFTPSTDPAQGQPICEREKVEARYVITDHTGAGYWDASNLFTDQYHFSGGTELVARLRCHVAGKLGEEVEIPEVLL